MKVLGTYDPLDLEAWLKLRLRGLGGSDAAAIMGADDWRGPYDVWKDRVEPDTTPRAGGEAAYWGTVLERIVADEFATRHNFDAEDTSGTLIRVTERPVVYQHATVPCMLATVDRLVYPALCQRTDVCGHPACIMPEHFPVRGLLEIKTRSGFVTEQWKNGPPLKVWWQVQHYLAVVGLRDAWVAVLLGGQRYQDYYVGRDDSAIAELEAKCEWLWDLVERKVAPPLDGSKAQREMLEELYPEAKPDTMVQISECDDDLELLADLREYKSLSHNIKHAEKQLLGVKTRIQSRIGEAEYLVDETGSRLARWATVKSERFDAKSFRADYPDLAKAYMVDTSHRTLTVKGASE